MIIDNKTQQRNDGQKRDITLLLMGGLALLAAFAFGVVPKLSNIPAQRHYKAVNQELVETLKSDRYGCEISRPAAYSNSGFNDYFFEGPNVTIEYRKSYEKNILPDGTCKYSLKEDGMHIHLKKPTADYNVEEIYIIKDIINKKGKNSEPKLEEHFEYLNDTVPRSPFFIDKSEKDGLDRIMGTVEGFIDSKTNSRMTNANVFSNL